MSRTVIVMQLRCTLRSLLAGLAAMIVAASAALAAEPAQEPRQPKVKFAQGLPAAEIDERFQRTDGWIGGDGGFSIPLSAERTLWLFADTWVGKLDAGSRAGAGLVNNTAAVQTGHGGAASLEFTVARDSAGQPVALFTPADGKGWLWPQAGVRLGDKLAVFFLQVEKTGEEGAFGFRSIGLWLGWIENPDDPPQQWKVTYQPVAATEFSKERWLAFGAAILAEDELLYVYGIDEKPGAVAGKHLIIARVARDRLAEDSAWEFWGESGWQRDFRRVSHLADGLANELSVTWLPSADCYALVYNEIGISPWIAVRTATSPVGPWSDPVRVYRCPEADDARKVFCYGAKAHPRLAGPNELVIEYFANAFDFWTVVKDGTLYWPRFVRVPVE